MKYLEPVIMGALKDKVYDIRHMVVTKIADLCKVYKTDWLEKSLLAKMDEILTHSNYILRISVVQSLAVIHI